MVTVWVLNLDAELELARPRHYAPTREVREHVARFAALARALLEPGDRELGDGDGHVSGRGHVGRCWCPTPSALGRLRAAGIEPAPAPALEVLRRVCERGFAGDLREPGARGGWARDAAGVHARLAEAPARERWLLKRGFSLAGRGRRRVTAGALTDEDRRWIEAALRAGGLQVEPWRAIEVEFALHGLLEPDGVVHRGRPCVQVCGPAGDWRSTRPARPGDWRAGELEALEGAFGRCARALAEAGFHGPFGLDAYRHAQGFEPLSELNARYSMGWAVGFGRCAGLSAPAGRGA